MEIRLATASSLGAVKRIADDNRMSLGFSPRPVFEQGLVAGELFVASFANAVCGFCLFHVRKDNVLKIYQICVDEPKRRLGVGSSMVKYLVNIANTVSASRIQLLCPEELDANKFYWVSGFSKGQVVQGKKRRLQSWYIQLERKS